MKGIQVTTITAVPSVGTLALMVLHVLTNLRLQHWKTRSYAAHEALGGAYSDLGDELDKFVEMYQGRKGVIDNADVPFQMEGDSIMTLRTLRRFIDDNRDMMCSESEIQNQIDEILAVIDKTLYKLEMLS